MIKYQNIIKSDTPPNSTDSVIWIDGESNIRIFLRGKWESIGGISEDTINEINKTLKDSIKGESTNRENADKELQGNIDDALALIVKLHAVINASASPANIYKGENTNVNINHSASFDGSPLTYNLTVDGNALSNPYTLDNSKSFNVVFNINNQEPKLVTSIARTVTVNAYYPRYYGRVDKEILTSDDILKLEKQGVASNATVSNKTFTSSIADYLWLCVPSGMTVNSVTSGGFAVPMEKAVTVAVEGKGNYNCYRSTNKANAGSVTYNIS